jgi:hypothetical protein
LATIAWIILTSAEASDAVELNTEAAMVDPREIDSPLSNGLGLGDLQGKFVLPARLLSDPYYEIWHEHLGSLPVHTLNSETLFLPPQEDDEEMTP